MVLQPINQNRIRTSVLIRNEPKLLQLTLDVSCIKLRNSIAVLRLLSNTGIIRWEENIWVGGRSVKVRSADTAGTGSRLVSADTGGVGNRLVSAVTTGEGSRLVSSAATAVMSSRIVSAVTTGEGCRLVFSSAGTAGRGERLLRGKILVV
jgi:hypothetical protein